MSHFLDEDEEEEDYEGEDGEGEEDFEDEDEGDEDLEGEDEEDYDSDEDSDVEYVQYVQQPPPGPPPEPRLEDFGGETIPECCQEHYGLLVIGKENYQFKILPLDGVTIKSADLVLFPTLVAPSLRGINRARKVNIFVCSNCSSPLFKRH